MTKADDLKLARKTYAQYIRIQNGADTDEDRLREIVNGDLDNMHGVQIALLAIQAERARIVAWLNDREGGIGAVYVPSLLATAIASGQHVGGEDA